MRANPINLLLTGIAVADMLVMVEYIPFATHMYVMEDRYDTYEEKVTTDETFGIRNLLLLYFVTNRYMLSKMSVSSVVKVG